MNKTYEIRTKASSHGRIFFLYHKGEFVCSCCRMEALRISARHCWK